MHNLSNVTFNIPVKIDCPERLENLKLVIDYLLHHFDTNIIVYEVSKGQPFYTERNSRVKYLHESIGSNPFHRTRYLNEMALLSRTPIIVNYDCDVLLPPASYLTAAELVLKSGASGVFPYDGLFLNVPRVHIPRIRETKDLSFIDINTTENFGRGSVGGALFWDKKNFIKGGMENENFISWGCEDWERIKRFSKLGHKLARVAGPLYHMSHPRGTDSCDSNPYYTNNQKVYLEVENMPVDQMPNYVVKQPWMSIFV